MTDFVFAVGIILLMLLLNKLLGSAARVFHAMNAIVVLIAIAMVMTDVSTNKHAASFVSLIVVCLLCSVSIYILECIEIRIKKKREMKSVLAFKEGVEDGGVKRE